LYSFLVEAESTPQPTEPTNFGLIAQCLNRIPLYSIALFQSERVGLLQSCWTNYETCCEMKYYSVCNTSRLKRNLFVCVMKTCQKATSAYTLLSMQLMFVKMLHYYALTGRKDHGELKKCVNMGGAALALRHLQRIAHQSHRTDAK
jgi:hypothetical protein